MTKLSIAALGERGEKQEGLGPFDERLGFVALGRLIRSRRLGR